MKLSHYQESVLARIAAGDVRVDGPQDLTEKLVVVTSQWSRDGHDIVAHRTVLVANPTGNPRTDYRTELYRIGRDGAVTRL